MKKVTKISLVLSFVFISIGLYLFAEEQCTMSITCTDGAQIGCSSISGVCDYKSDTPPGSGFVKCGTKTYRCHAGDTITLPDWGRQPQTIKFNSKLK
jgi:hypothetical protein